jgi:hypothetical protein
MKNTFYLLYYLFLVFPCAAQEDALAAFSDPARLWGGGIEKVIEEAYRQCFRTRIIGGRVITIRMPFAQNNDRDLLTEQSWQFLGGGKGNPALLWPIINEIIDSKEFDDYIKALSSGRERVLIFDIPAQNYSSSVDLFDIARMKAGSYRGLPHKPYVLISGRGMTESDVYNYLYCIGLVGMDCSGFVWHILTHIGRQGGINLGAVLRAALGVPRGADPAWYAGTAFYNSNKSQIIAVQDKIINLRPADIILFRGIDGNVGHSAIIQSINFEKGIIRYLQCTDEAPLNERGVHESFIYFDPDREELSLNDLSLTWTQKRFAPFPGEKDSAFSNDGLRYRSNNGRVVRIKALVPVIEKLKLTTSP